MHQTVLIGIKGDPLRWQKLRSDHGLMHICLQRPCSSGPKQPYMNTQRCPDPCVRSENSQHRHYTQQFRKNGASGTNKLEKNRVHLVFCRIIKRPLADNDKVFLSLLKLYYVIGEKLAVSLYVLDDRFKTPISN